MAHTDTTGRIIRAQELTSLVTYSQQHIRRLEAANQFPKRVRIGHNRIGWVRAEVEQWLNSKVDER